MRRGPIAIVMAVVGGCTAAPPEGDKAAGIDACATCHDEEARYSRYGAHRAVECERCHGPGGEHARADNVPRPRLTLGGVDLCLSCHREGPSAETVSTIRSFDDHLDALEREHRIKLDRRKSGTGCVYCHDPHLLE